MADQKKLVAEITSMDEDFTQWYTDVWLRSHPWMRISHNGIRTL